MQKILITLFVLLTLAACQWSYDPYAAIQQPVNTSPAPTDKPTATAPGPQVCTVTADALHVRRGPGLSYAVIGYLQAGDIVTIETQRGAWLKIGAASWVHAKYCEVKK